LWLLGAQRVLALEVERRTGHLEEGEAGAVVHLEEGMERQEWGWTTPALVGEDGGLIAGHARILAARQLSSGQPSDCLGSTPGLHNSLSPQGLRALPGAGRHEAQYGGGGRGNTASPIQCPSIQASVDIGP
jgi:hypothetical protein